MLTIKHPFESQGDCRFRDNYVPKEFSATETTLLLIDGKIDYELSGNRLAFFDRDDSGSGSFIKYIYAKK
ncbi:MAG: hypothetical protein Q4G08_04895 [Capnocytophaga sp.]|nr:hypothetical protein [Capnocytophaga sp.]